MIAAGALSLPVLPADSFRCVALRATLSGAACLARQDVRRSWSNGTQRGGVPAYAMCGPAEAGGESPCEQGRAVRAALGVAPAPRAVRVRPVGFEVRKRAAMAPVARRDGRAPVGVGQGVGGTPPPAPPSVAAVHTEKETTMARPATEAERQERRERLRARLIVGPLPSAELRDIVTHDKTLRDDMAAIGAVKVGGRKGRWTLGAAPARTTKASVDLRAVSSEALVAELRRRLEVADRVRAAVEGA